MCDYTRKNNLDINVLCSTKRSNSTKRSKLTAREIKAITDSFDEDHPLYGKVCVIMGTLETLTRKEAMQVIVDLGGINGDVVTKKTNYLILGNNDYCKRIKDGKSNKQKMAEKNILKGQDISIISENIFYDMLSQ